VLAALSEKRKRGAISAIGLQQSRSREKKEREREKKGKENFEFTLPSPLSCE
jgi:hypothetical protein